MAYVLQSINKHTPHVHVSNHTNKTYNLHTHTNTINSHPHPHLPSGKSLQVSLTGMNTAPPPLTGIPPPISVEHQRPLGAVGHCKAHGQVVDLSTKATRLGEAAHQLVHLAAVGRVLEVVDPLSQQSTQLSSAHHLPTPQQPLHHLLHLGGVVMQHHHPHPHMTVPQLSGVGPHLHVPPQLCYQFVQSQLSSQ